MGTDEEFSGDDATAVAIEARLGVGIPGWLASLGRTRVEADEVAYLVSRLGAGHRWAWYRVSTVRNPSRGTSIVLAVLDEGQVTVGARDVPETVQDGWNVDPAAVWPDTKPPTTRDIRNGYVSGVWRDPDDSIHHGGTANSLWGLYSSCPIIDGLPCGRCASEGRLGAGLRDALGRVNEAQTAHWSLVKAWARTEATDRVRVQVEAAVRFSAVAGVC